MQAVAGLLDELYNTTINPDAVCFIRNFAYGMGTDQFTLEGTFRDGQSDFKLRYLMTTASHSILFTLLVTPTVGLLTISNQTGTR